MDCKDISIIMIIVCSIHITLHYQENFLATLKNYLHFFNSLKKKQDILLHYYFTQLSLCNTFFFKNPVQENIKTSRRHHIYYPELIDSFGMRESKKKREASERDDKIMIIEKRLESVYTCVHAWEEEKKREHEPRNATHQFDEQHHVVTDTQKQKSCE